MLIRKWKVHTWNTVILFQKSNHESLYVLAINEDIIEKLKIAMPDARWNQTNLDYPTVNPDSLKPLSSNTFYKCKHVILLLV